MKRIFISFLGMGPDGEGYSELNYQMEGKPERISTEFVQMAEIEFLGSDSFDKIFILCTKKSHDYSFHDLRDELNDNLCIDRQKIEHVPINNVETIKHAWELFDKIKSLKTLDKYEVPKDILFLKSFVKTANGKISRKNTLLQIMNQ